MSEYLAQFQTYLYIAPVVLIAIVLHECAHGWMSDKLGDPTPRAAGRLSLNPLKHLDLVGALCLLIFHVGWAKPVPINPSYYENKKKGMIAVSLAGPVTNFIMAFLFLMGYGLFIRFDGLTTNVGWIGGQLCYYGAVINVGLGLFNLIPLPPLDGSNVVAALSSKIAGLYRKYNQITRIALVVLLVSGVLSTPLTYINQLIINGMSRIVELILF